MGSLSVFKRGPSTNGNNKNNVHNSLLDRSSLFLELMGGNTRRAVNEELWLKLAFHSKWAINF